MESWHLECVCVCEWMWLWKCRTWPMTDGARGDKIQFKIHECIHRVDNGDDSICLCVAPKHNSICAVMGKLMSSKRGHDFLHKRQQHCRTLLCAPVKSVQAILDLGFRCGWRMSRARAHISNCLRICLHCVVCLRFVLSVQVLIVPLTLPAQLSQFCVVADYTHAWHFFVFALSLSHLFQFLFLAWLSLAIFECWNDVPKSEKHKIHQ